jgi:flagellar basal body-associated protein FliL
MTTDPHASGRRRARLRTIGILVLLLGLGGAGAVYWTGAPPEDFSANPATARAYRTESRDIEINFGKMGLVMNDLLDDLKYPRTQAAIIAVVSLLVASGCFCFAQWLERGGEPDDPVA